MRIVVGQGEILELEIMNVFHRRIELHARKRTKLAGKLRARLFEMILVKVQIAEGVNEFAGAQIADLRDHHREQGVGSDVERHAEEQIGAPLIELTA